MKTYNALLPAVLAEAPQAQRREAVDAFLRDLTRRGLLPDLVTWNIIIKYYAEQVGDEREEKGGIGWMGGWMD